MRYVLSAILFFCLNMTIYADVLSSLTLTDAEMQKLKKYFPEEDTRHLVWTGEPISIALPINKEKRLIFPVSVSVDVKSALNEDQLRIVNNDQSIYLTALKQFSVTRIYVTLKETGKVILLDLMADGNASDATQQIDIKLNNNPVSIKTKANNEPVSSFSENMINNDISFIDLIRFAWQEVYAPERLIHNRSVFTRAPMHTEKFVSDLVYGDKVIAYPEGSWIGGNQYITAVLLRNKYPHQTYINIRRDLCGNWQAGSIYPTGSLKSYGNKRGDSAMLFLISTQSFGDAMRTCHGDA